MPRWPDKRKWEVRPVRVTRDDGDERAVPRDEAEVALVFQSFRMVHERSGEPMECWGDKL